MPRASLYFKDFSFATTFSRSDVSQDIHARVVVFVPTVDRVDDWEAKYDGWQRTALVMRHMEETVSAGDAGDSAGTEEDA